MLLNGVANAAALNMELAGIAHRLVRESAPEVKAPAPTPADYKPLLGLYASESMDEMYRVEWRDGKLVVCVPGEPAETVPLEPRDEPDTFVAGLGFRPSGEAVRFRRLPSGQVASVFVGGGTLLRLDPVPPSRPTADRHANALRPICSSSKVPAMSTSALVALSTIARCCQYDQADAVASDGGRQARGGEVGRLAPRCRASAHVPGRDVVAGGRSVDGFG